MKALPETLRKGIIQPKYILAIVLVLMAMMVAMALYEISASRQDVMSVLREEATSLAEAISIMSDNSLVCFGEIEYLVSERLLSNARILELWDSSVPLSEEMLIDIVEQNDIHGIRVYSENGNIILDSHMEEDPVLPRLGMLVKDFLGSNEDESIIDLDEADRYVIAVRRRKGGAIVMGVDSLEILEFRKAIGVGSLIQEIGENEGIEYIVLQDENGLILASRNVTQMLRIAEDNFLQNALDNRKIDTRTYLFHEQEVVEIVSPFQIDAESYALFRIGLSMDEVRAVESRGRNRLILIALVVLAVGGVSLSLLLVSQNHSLLSRAYNRIQTYTGMVLENIADGIIVLDKDGNISVFNKAAELIFRRSSDEIIGSPMSELPNSVAELLAEAVNGKVLEQNTEIRVSIPELGTRLLSIRTSHFLGTDTAADSVVGIVRDITETRTMEENIRRTEQLTAMGKLASAVAHEVRNPLNAISMIAQRLGREFSPQDDSEQYRELTSMVKSESSRLNGIIEQFLEFARPPKLNRQQVDIDQLLDETVSLVAMQAAEYGVEIYKEYSNLGGWLVDREQMKQALLNLFLNGIEAMPDGGLLSVKGYIETEMLCIEISDTGKGIPKDVMPRIFDLYFTTKETGTGLGLSIVQRIIMEHGGWLDVSSEPGMGAIFKIHLPDKLEDKP
jgi:PAS domain S-box-containing protein